MGLTPTMSCKFLPPDFASYILETEAETGKNNFFRKKVIGHFNFSMEAEAKREEAISASITSYTRP